jgi:protein-S-isoprenylcysteine O-methyltransferase Ste14
MYTAFSVVMAVQTPGLARRIAIFYGQWTDADPMPADDWTLYVGMTVFLAGVGLRLWAVRMLGRLFTFAIGVRTEHRIVQDGPYRWVRHPSYTGYLLVALGIALSYASLVGMIAVVVGIGGFYTLRIPAEERIPEAHFGYGLNRLVQPRLAAAQTMLNAVDAWCGGV